MAVTLYFTVAATLWLRESIHLALIMLQLNVLEGLLALKIKSLNDCVAKAVQQMLTKQMEFAMLVGVALGLHYSPCALSVLAATVGAYGKEEPFELAGNIE